MEDDLSTNHTKKEFLSTSQPKTADMSTFSHAIVKATPVLLLLVSLTLMIFHHVGAIPVEKMRTSMMDAVSPVLSVASAPIIYTVEMIDEMTHISYLKAENIQLTAENEKLRKWYEQALELQAENQSFRELLNVKVDATVNYVTARIISDSGTSFVRSVLLPVGLKDNVKKGSAVMSGYGLVGRVIESGRKSSRALLVTDLNSRIPVVIQNTRIKAILAGKNQDLLKLERLPTDSGVVVGSRVVTSGDGGQLPAEIPIGIIIKSGADGVWVKLLSDISKLTYVQVVNVNIDDALANGEVR